MQRRMSAERLECAALAAEVMRAAQQASHTKEREVAYAIGVARSRAHRWCDPQDELSLTLRDLLVLRIHEPALFRAVVDRLVELLPGHRQLGLCPSRHVAVLASELGDVGRETALALADGRVDSRERQRLLKELGDLIEAARRALADVEGCDANSR